MRAAVWTEQAREDLRRLDPGLVKRIRQAVRRFAAEGGGDLKKLKGYTDQWRLRVGDWRVIMTLANDPPRAIVTRVLPRQSAYRG
jgi:mRNA interferase RelE/StbE